MTFQRLCDAGTTAEFVTLGGDGHLGPLRRAGRLEQLAEWMHDRLNGVAAKDDC